MLISAQGKALAKGDHRNNTNFADEIKKTIQKGESDRKEGEAVVEKGEIASDELVNKVLHDPLLVSVDKIPSAVFEEVNKKLLASFELFCLWAFQIQMGFKFQKQDFHTIMFDACQKIIDGVPGYDRLIVTIPPRHSKTQILSILLPLYSFCNNASSHNIITSYADDVVQESSGYIRTIMLDPLFMRCFPKLRIDQSKRSLERWGTSRQGVMHAIPTGGKMTGKGAGTLSDKYSGLFVVDDAIKPKDAYSATVRAEINDRFDNTFMSRLANDGVIQDDEGNEVECGRTPMAIIMQRVHDDDLVGHLLRGGSTDNYKLLNIPALLHDDTGSKEWYDKLIIRQNYSNADPITYNLPRENYPAALWPSRKGLDSLLAMQETNPYTFNSQYMGDPTAKGSGLIAEDWWEEYEELDKASITQTFMTSDTASTIQSYSDYSVMCMWGVSKDKDLILIDVELGKWEIPELKIVLLNFWKKHNEVDRNFPRLLPRAMYMEDKSSGHYLNQQFMREGNIRCLPVPRDRSGADKVSRFLNATTYFAQGRIKFPAEHKHKAHVMREVLGMTGKGSGTGNDDVIDNISDACIIAFEKKSANYASWV